jgi:hypothetical protein
MDFTIASILPRRHHQRRDLCPARAGHRAGVHRDARHLHSAGRVRGLGALTLAMLQAGQVPGTVWLLLMLAGVASLMELVERWRHHGQLAGTEGGPQALLAPAGGVRLARGGRRRSSFRSGAGPAHVAVVTPMGPLVYRVAYQSLETATPLVLLIVSVGVHFAMPAWGCSSSAPRVSATPASGTRASARARHRVGPDADHHLRGLAGADRAAVAVLRAVAAPARRCAPPPSTAPARG